MKIYVAHSSAFDFRKKLYEPLRASHLQSEHDIFLPQETGEEEVTKDLIKSCELVIAEVSLPSTGEGIELGWADMQNVPILCIYEDGARYSSSLNYITRNFISYASADDLIEKVNAFIQTIHA